MDLRGTAYRRLAQVVRELDGKGIAHAHINTLAIGHDKPSMRAMELIAPVCDVDPTTSPARVARDLVQVGRGGIGAELGPWHLDRFVVRHAVAGFEREQLQDTAEWSRSP